MTFVPLWYILITILWTGFFVLEGFDLGVGMLHGIVGRDDAGKRAVINTIGPLWDGNEVWLIVAGAAMFSAFPGWYATMFSAFYLAMVLLLGALIVRGVSFEYRGKSPSERWRDTWDWLLAIGSLLVPFVIGIALGDLLHGLPINSSHEYTGTFWGLFQPYAILTGIMLVAVCLMHGGAFIAMKTTDEVRTRAWRIAKAVSPAAALLVLAFVGWTHVEAHGGAFLNLIELIACIAAIGAVLAITGDHMGWGFTATTITIASCIVTLFVDLYPRVMVSSTNPAYSLTVNNTASGGYTLKVMSVIALVLLPLVLGYQAWTYYVFRRRVSVHHFRPGSAPAMPPAPAPASGAPASAPVQRPPVTSSGPQQAVPAGQAPPGSRRGGRHRHWRGKS
jgi:cytochrome bd ubiquinol oxidase subunit II